MPELPEVETIARGLREKIVGKTIIKLDWTGHVDFVSEPSKIARISKDRKIAAIHRHGKALYFELTSESNPAAFLNVHLGMTGQLLHKTQPENPDHYTHAVFQLREGDQLQYRDVRRFGKMKIFPVLPKNGIPDAWLAPESELFSRLRAKTGMIKHALLNQHVLAGLGNIYVDEALYVSRIHPKDRLERLSDERVKILCTAIKGVLASSLGVGGTSFRNYVDIYGSRGGFKKRLHVYGKQGTPCPEGHGIVRQVIAGRGTHFCPVCQVREKGRRNHARKGT